MNNNPEKELILAIAPPEGDAAQLRQPPQQQLDWEYVLATAYAHGLLPLLQNHLSTVGGDLVPSHFLSRLKRESVTNSQTVLHLMGKQLRVYKLFKEHEIPVALFKGAVLA